MGFFSNITSSGFEIPPPASAKNALTKDSNGSGALREFTSVKQIQNAKKKQTTFRLILVLHSCIFTIGGVAIFIEKTFF